MTGQGISQTRKLNKHYQDDPQTLRHRNQDGKYKYFLALSGYFKNPASFYDEHTLVGIWNGVKYEQAVDIEAFDFAGAGRLYGRVWEKSGGGQYELGFEPTHREGNLPDPPNSAFPFEYSEWMPPRPDRWRLPVGAEIDKCGYLAKLYPEIKYMKVWYPKVTNMFYTPSIGTEIWDDPDIAKATYRTDLWMSAKEAQYMAEKTNLQHLYKNYIAVARLEDDDQFYDTLVLDNNYIMDTYDEHALPISRGFSFYYDMVSTGVTEWWFDEISRASGEEEEEHTYQFGMQLFQVRGEWWFKVRPLFKYDGELVPDEEHKWYFTEFRLPMNVDYSHIPYGDNCVKCCMYQYHGQFWFPDIQASLFAVPRATTMNEDQFEAQRRLILPQP